MPTYRYSEAGRQRLVTLAGRQSFIFSGVIVTGVGLIFTYKYGLEFIREAWWLFATLGAALGAAYYFGQRRQVRKVAQALLVTLDDEALTVNNGPIRLTIAPHEVTAFGYIKEGIKIRGRDLNHLFVLYRDLENFDDLQSRLEQWVPAHIPRTNTGARFGILLWAAILPIWSFLQRAYIFFQQP